MRHSHVYVRAFLADAPDLVHRVEEVVNVLQDVEDDNDIHRVVLEWQAVIEISHDVDAGN